MYVLEFHEALFDEPQQVAARSPPQGWRIFAECTTDDPESCNVNCSTGDWGAREFSDYLSLMVSLCRKAVLGVPLETLFDVKKLHEVADVEVTRVDRSRTSIKLWQLRKQDVRFLFFYGEGNHIVIAAHAFIKRGDKVPPAAVEAGRQAAQAYFNALDSSSINTVTLQGESHEFSEAHKRPR